MIILYAGPHVKPECAKKGLTPIHTSGKIEMFMIAA